MASDHHVSPKASPQQGSWRIASVAGIPIRVHWLMLVALPFFAYLMATDISPAATKSPSRPSPGEA